MQYPELKMILLIWINVVLLNTFVTTQKIRVHQPKPLITASSGDNVTLQCFLLGEQSSEPVVWYKQAAGHEPALVAVAQKVQDPIYKDEFNSRFRIEKGSQSCNLKIINVKLSDEAAYYCGLITFYTVFANGTFLSVKRKADISVSVSQLSVLERVPAGASVTLQCSVLSESRAAELQVLWFRAAPTQSHPQIIYTHHNSSHQCESVSSTHTCVYNFSKNILSLNDTGTYYCAVAACGKIIFGIGTRVQMENPVKSLGPEEICFTVVLAVCVVVIFTQAFIICKMRNSDQSWVRPQLPSAVETTLNQSPDVTELNYAALHFNKKKTNRMTRTREEAEDCVYSKVSPAS